MKRLLDWVQGFALALGGPGLFLIAFLDSSFLSFPEVVDLLIVWLSIQHPHRMVYYALLSTLGSIGGCVVLFLLARKGGEAFLRRRLHERHIERAITVVRKYGVLSVLIPSLLPPPAPFKIFVLGAGVARVRLADFLIAVTIGRGIRYFGEGLLALWYGERAAAFLRDNARLVGLWMAAIALVLGVGAVWWQRRQRAINRDGGNGGNGDAHTEKRRERRRNGEDRIDRDSGRRAASG
jgi:membrane protein YqaA with SNARE-associated domain